MKLPVSLVAFVDLLRTRRGATMFAMAALCVIALLGVNALNQPHASAAAQAPACERRTFEGSIFTICTYNSRTDELRLAWTGKDGKPLRNFTALASDLGANAARVRFAMNAGMFNARGAPIGLYVENSKQRHGLSTGDGPGNFHMKPNGVLSLYADGAVHVEPAGVYLARGTNPLWATQSGPMLVIAGALHPEIQDDGASRYVRNGVGQIDPHTAVFVISEAPVSFGRIARLFRDELKCENALYFDGAISSLWLPSADRLDQGYALGPMVVVLARK